MRESGRGGEGEDERGAVVQFAFGADRSAVGEHDVFGDGEAEASPSGLAGASLVDAIKAFKETGQMLGRNAGAEILDVELDSPSGGPCAQDDASAGAAVFHRVVDEVGEDLVNGLAVG